MVNTTRISLSAVLFAFALTSCNLTPQNPPIPPNPPVNEFPVIDVQHPSENYLGLDNITRKSKIDPAYLQADLEVRQYWDGAILGDFADITKVGADGTFTLTITASKINAKEYGFQPYYGTPDPVPAHILLYDSNHANLSWLEGEVQRKTKDVKYNRVVYAPADFTYIKTVTYPAFPNGYTYSIKLKKGFNLIYVQEKEGDKGLLTTSYKYQAPYFTDFLKW